MTLLGVAAAYALAIDVEQARETYMKSIPKSEDARENQGQRERAVWKRIKLTALLCFILLTWLIAFLIVTWTNILSYKPSDLATLVFGASSIALFVFSFIVGILGFWGLEGIYNRLQIRLDGFVNQAVDTAVEKAADAKVLRVQNELRGRTFSTLGYISGEMSLRYGEGVIEVVDKDKLAEAIALLETGYDFLHRLGGAAEYMALNNLLFYSLMNDDRTRAGFLVGKAEELLRVAQEQRSANTMLTACGVILRYGTDEAKRRAFGILESLKEQPKLSRKQRVEAQYYLGFISAKGAPPHTS